MQEEESLNTTLYIHIHSFSFHFVYDVLDKNDK